MGKNNINRHKWAAVNPTATCKSLLFVITIFKDTRRSALTPPGRLKKENLERELIKTRRPSGYRSTLLFIGMIRHWLTRYEKRIAVCVRCYQTCTYRRLTSFTEHRESTLVLFSEKVEYVVHVLPWSLRSIEQNGQSWARSIQLVHLWKKIRLRKNDDHNDPIEISRALLNETITQEKNVSYDKVRCFDHYLNHVCFFWFFLLHLCSWLRELISRRAKIDAGRILQLNQALTRGDHLSTQPLFNPPIANDMSQ